MKLQNGGYVIVTHDDANIYKKVASAYENGKPILFYDDDKKCYYIDSIAKGVDVYTLVKGGKTFEVTSSNTLSSTGKVDAPTMENIKDLNGNLRFIESDITMTSLTGIEFTYTKWSLSGTHFMIVVSGKILNGTTTTKTSWFQINLPDYIKDKIIPTFANDQTIDYKTFECRTTNGTNPQNLILSIFKTSSGYIGLYNNSEITLTDDKYFRIQFDLLIDAE